MRPEVAEGLLPGLVEVPAGPFLMGSRDDNPLADDGEKPQHKCNIPYAYRIGRHPVTNAEFTRFVKAGGYEQERFWTKAGWKWKGEAGCTGPEPYGAPFDQPDHPVVGVSWYEAVAYCNWLTGELRAGGVLTGKERVCLPGEAEWEKAARGEHGREWPWGDEFDPAKANTAAGGPGHTTPVGRYSPAGDSPYGCADMAGNVWEWTRSHYRGYPYRPDDGREELEGAGHRMVRGGSFGSDERRVRCACRNRNNPNNRNRNIGFRVVVVHAFPYAGTARRLLVGFRAEA